MADSPKPASSPAAKAVSEPDHDRVAMASRRPDGSPAQTADFEYIGDKEVAVEAAKEQLKQQAVSAVDAKERAALAADEEIPQDPTVEKLTEAHDKAAAAAEKAAESEVNARYNA